MRTLLLIFSFLAINIAHAKPCIFCNPDIVETQTVYQTEHFNVLPDLEPRVKGHLLVVPKRHIARAHELSKEEWSELSEIIPKTVDVFLKILHTDQYVIIEKNGPNAFQQIPHVHFHLIPVTTQTWDAIFSTVPKKLTPEAFEQKCPISHLFQLIKKELPPLPTNFLKKNL